MALIQHYIRLVVSHQHQFNLETTTATGFENALDFARSCDAQDGLAGYRSQFHLPVIDGKEVLYFTGNSLGLQPKTVATHVQQELNDWAQWGVEGHFHAKNPWYAYHEFLTPSLAKLVGAHPDEVVAMNALTANLHFLLVSFYTQKENA